MWSDSARRGSHESLRASAEHKARERILEIGFDYIGGYTDSDGKVFVRCRKCGNVFEAAYQPIRKRGMITCPVCCDAERAEREELKRLERDAAAIKKMMLSYRKHIEAEKAKAKAHAKRVHRCPICGKPAERTLCCSDDCTRKYVNRVKDQRRRAKITDALVDADIQLAEVYRRDNGICYLCGGLCDFSDCVTTANGSFLAGDKYPSIDHVVPLAAGGKHSWDNVRLAHRICNSIKSDSIAPFVEK
ncbi:MAG: HNH endonuclease [Oscillospiraceae bacterium]|nr:HNH endonuclease [Oscillospiraceae bacterium]